eukprot:CAMPEP_0184481614 /NCGR_PEP_ID=MMETSP0113_2-20130426/3170_1 /TAXON_ID=91329 /ORGANISM="Norrisiella sphaerica, Strain BC52" /LENGTH=228 /DNA_ID=CAMNT_0026860833 /DNA_START=830 /DNA_END=1516 /DNA_ORIENTATION=+
MAQGGMLAMGIGMQYGLYFHHCEAPEETKKSEKRAVELKKIDNADGPRQTPSQMSANRLYLERQASQPQVASPKRSCLGKGVALNNSLFNDKGLPTTPSPLANGNAYVRKNAKENRNTTAKDSKSKLKLVLGHSLLGDCPGTPGKHEEPAKACNGAIGVLHKVAIIEESPSAFERERSKPSRKPSGLSGVQPSGSLGVGSPNTNSILGSPTPLLSAKSANPGGRMKFV